MMEVLKQIPDKIWLLALFMFLVPLYLWTKDQIIGALVTSVGGALLIAFKTKQQTVNVTDRTSAQTMAKAMTEE